MITDDIDDDGDIANDNNIVRLLRVYCGYGVQPVEDAGQQLLNQRGLATAIGAQLDVIGRIVGQPRDTALSDSSDDLYRRVLAGRIAATRSQGNVEDLIKVASLVIGDPVARIRVSRDGTATTRVRVANVALDDDIAVIVHDLESDAVAAGVRLIDQWSDVAPSATFTLDLGVTGHDGLTVTTGLGLDGGKLSGALDNS
jgi:hypothetical protein